MLESPLFNGTIFAPSDGAFTSVEASDGPMTDAFNGTMARVIAFHIVPGLRAFPLSNLKSGSTLPTLVEGHPLFVDRT